MYGVLEWNVLGDVDEMRRKEYTSRTVLNKPERKDRITVHRIFFTTKPIYLSSVGRLVCPCATNRNKSIRIVNHCKCIYSVVLPTITIYHLKSF